MPQQILSHDKNTAKIEFTCDNCGKKYTPSRQSLFDYENKRRKHTFCSRECSHNFSKVNVIRNCNNCGKEFILSPKQRNTIKKFTIHNYFCSRKCQYEYQTLSEEIRKMNRRISKNRCEYNRRNKINNVPLTEEEQEMVDAIYKKRKYLTETTGIPYEVDHIISISSGRATNHPYNLQIITAWSNSIKGCSIPNLDTLSGIHEEQRKYLKSLIKPKNGKSKSN